MTATTPKPSPLLDLLTRHIPFNAQEAAMTEQARRFVAAQAEAFSRDLAGQSPQRGHVTGSAWVVNASRSQVLVVHHAKLGRWVQPGGHCDGEADVLSVAQREVREETSLEATPLTPEIFDVDVHLIPEYWNTPEHLHFDIRFLLQADDRLAPVASAESRAVRWVSLDEVLKLNSSDSIARMVAKTRTLAQSR